MKAEIKMIEKVEKENYIFNKKWANSLGYSSYNIKRISHKFDFAYIVNRHEKQKISRRYIIFEVGRLN